MCVYRVCIVYVYCVCAERNLYRKGMEVNQTIILEEVK
jgi:hypothetical protein